MLGPEKIIEQRYAPRVYLPCLTIGLVLVQLVYVFLKKSQKQDLPRGWPSLNLLCIARP